MTNLFLGLARPARASQKLDRFGDSTGVLANV